MTELSLPPSLPNKKRFIHVSTHNPQILKTGPNNNGVL